MRNYSKYSIGSYKSFISSRVIILLYSATSVQQLLSLLSQSLIINITSESRTLLNATFEKYLWNICEKVWTNVDSFAVTDFIVDRQKKGLSVESMSNYFHKSS